MYSIKLTSSFGEINLLSSPYSVQEPFVPPGEVTTPLLAGGIGTNRLGGSSLISRRWENRAWEISIDLETSNLIEGQQATGKLQQFINAGIDDGSLEVYWNPHGEIPDPVWGQGFSRRYHVVNAALSFAAYPYPATVILSMEIEPFAFGQRTQMLKALGGIVEDSIGWADGLSRGLIIPEATTNKFTDPFLTGATWSFNGEVTKYQDYKLLEKYALFGWLPVLGACNSASNGTVTQSINVGNTNQHVLSCYVRRKDGAAITVTDGSLYYDIGTITTSYIPVGDSGWYRLVSAPFAGIASAKNAGIQVERGQSLLLTGFQLEEKSYVTPLAAGNMIGCSWTGTANASTSTRAAATIELIDIVSDASLIFNRLNGTASLVWKAPFASTHGSNLYLFTYAANLDLYFDAATDQFVITDGHSTVQSTVQTFAAGDVIVFDVCWDATMRLYINGVLNGTPVTFMSSDDAANILLGTQFDGTVHSNGLFVSFEIFDHGLSATEVAAKYSALLPIISAAEPLTSIPWRWFPQTNSQYNGVISAANTQYNAGVFGGIPGSEAADTELDFSRTGVSPATGGTVLNALFGLHAAPYTEYINPGSLFFADLSGTNVAGTLGGAVKQTTVATAEVSLGDITISKPFAKQLYGKTFYLIGKLADAGTLLTLAGRVDYLSATEITSEFASVSADATYRGFKTMPLQPIDFGNLPDSKTIAASFKFSLLGKRPSGTGAVNCDYVAIIPRPCVMLVTTEQIDEFTLQGYRTIVKQATKMTFSRSGDEILFRPGVANVLLATYSINGQDTALTDYFFLTNVWITPRWGLL